MCVSAGALLPAITGCGGDGGASGGRTVVAAFYPLAFAAEEVAQGSADVRSLTPPGAEPHDLELTPRDVGRVRDARLVVYAGGGFQPAVEAAVEERDGPSLDVLAAVETLPVEEGEGSDPHVWLDPLRYAAIAQQISAALGPPASADALAARLRALHAELRAGLARCDRRELVTSHAAFGYLAERYGLEQVPLVGVAPEAEPGPKELERLVREVRESGATTVFSEPLAPSALAETVAREAGLETATLDPLEGLTPEAADAGVDYFDVMRDNLAALRKALSCR